LHKVERGQFRIDRVLKYAQRDGLQLVNNGHVAHATASRVIACPWRHWVAANTSKAEEPTLIEVW